MAWILLLILQRVVVNRIRIALRQYQITHGLPATGELDEATRKALGGQIKEVQNNLIVK